MASISWRFLSNEQAVEVLLSTREGNLVLEDDMGDGLISKLEGEWRLLFTSSSSMEFNQV